MRKILHVSDVHFGPPHRPEIAAALLDLVGERSPDLVVVAGDLTQRAKPRQFREARAWVDEIDAPTLAVPGNHDVPMYRFWERIFVPFGAYRKNFSPDLEPSLDDGELFVVGVNSAFNWTIKDGRVSAAQIQRVVEQFAAAPAGRFKIAVVHHELAPAPRFGAQKALANAEPLVAALSAGGVELVLSGHLHQSYALRAEAYYPGASPGMVLAYSGTTTSSRGRGCERGRNTGYWIEIEDDSIALHTLVWQPESLEFSTWSSHRYSRDTS